MPHLEIVGSSLAKYLREEEASLSRGEREHTTGGAGRGTGDLGRWIDVQWRVR